MTLREALNEDFGRVTTAMALLWLLAAVVVAAVFQRGEEVVRELPWRVAALIVGAGLIRTTGMNAHATQGSEPTWGAAAEFLHLVGISAWVGGLTVMTVCLLPRRRIAELERIVPKFSTIALASVLVIVTSGLILELADHQLRRRLLAHPLRPRPAHQARRCSAPCCSRR